MRQLVPNRPGPYTVRANRGQITSNQHAWATHRPWWRHQMETFSALLAICAGNSPGTGEFPARRPVTRSFGVFFNLRPNKRLSEQRYGWWFETPSSPLWCHCNAQWRRTTTRQFVPSSPGQHAVKADRSETSLTQLCTAEDLNCDIYTFTF